MTQPASDLTYEEIGDHLSIRVRAHKEFANLQLEDWYAENLDIPEGAALLDVGCGNGNWFPTWSKMLGDRGLLTGLEQSPELLSQAALVPTACQKLLLHLDLNDLGCFQPRSFDRAIASFSIYYATDPAATLRALHNILVEGGVLYMMGPTENNASELFEFNEKLFRVESQDRAKLRTARLEHEFLPVARELFSTVQTHIIPRKVTFPSREDHATYYQATLLFGESCEQDGRMPTREEILAVPWDNLVLGKEMIAIEARR